jgi:hypothetical protein
LGAGAGHQRPQPLSTSLAKARPSTNGPISRRNHHRNTLGTFMSPYTTIATNSATAGSKSRQHGITLATGAPGKCSASILLG